MQKLLGNLAEEKGKEEAEEAQTESAFAKLLEMHDEQFGDVGLASGS